jgi:type II secretory pathway component PulF
LLPRLAQTFSQLAVELPLISKVLINAGIFLKAHGIVAVPIAIVIFGVLMYLVFVAPKFKFIGQSILLHTPGIGRLLREVEIGQFGYLFGTLINAGLPINQALDLMQGSTTLRSYKKFYVYLAESLNNGDSLKTCLQKYKGSKKIAPLTVQQLLIAGERTGSLPDVLLTVGRTYEEKSDITATNLEALLEPILLVIVAVGVLAVAIAVILPIYSLVGGLNK